MNILYIHTHDTGRFIQPYGHAIPTPNLMALAREGALFRNCFDAAPTCSPSRAAMLTGMNAHSSGMIGLAHRGFALKDPTRHLAHHLRSHGFETVLCGVQHEIAAGQTAALGYERIIAAPATPGASEMAGAAGQAQRMMAQDLANAQAVAEFLRARSEISRPAFPGAGPSNLRNAGAGLRPSPRPFFLSFGMFSAHRPFPAPDADIDPGYIAVPSPLPDDPAIRLDMAGFITMARCADTCAGIVLDALAAAGLADDTLVFFTTDHGIAFPKMKCHLYDAGIGVSLIIRYPGHGQPGQVVDALVSHLDIYPTVCAAAGVPAPSWLEGRSLTPLLDGTATAIRDEIFAEVTYHAAYEPMRCIRTDRWKYIRYFDDYDLAVKPNIDDGHSKQFLLRHGLAEAKHDPAEMLFDLACDPAERINLAGSPDHAAIRAELAERLARWMRDTDDPLSAGYVLKPAGARVNLKWALHPNEQEFEA
ncbi:MAG: N-sulfoglucosamine sulfohydrolase [Chloroflexota bacterium]|nr:N-sulfoglucosamine sulfohydrolase [Chloroflexota bacterium]